MSDEELQNKCKQRFKGVENFLRRVAYNLGNSPSQTEVKIISCIPIDVTDLQQKIITLEKELDAAKAKTENQQNNVVQTVVCRHYSSTKPNSHCKPNETSQAAHIEQCEGACFTPSGSLSKGSVAIPAPSHIIHDCACWPSDKSSSHNEQFETIEKRGLFKKIKKKKMAKKKDKCKMQLVYYAQADNNPFATQHVTANEEQSTQHVHETLPNLHNEAISPTYLSEMIHKQYTAVPVAEDFSVTSKFSSPVCRDIDHSCEYSTAPKCYDSDLCSCIHNTFQNIDYHNQNNNLTACLYNGRNINTEFYDTSLYDMVPVKEKPMKAPNFSYEAPKRNLLKCDLNIPERSRQKYRYHPFIVNYSNTPPAPYNYSGKHLKLGNNRNKYRKNSPRRQEVMRMMEKYNENSSKSCVIECGNIYMKKVIADGKISSAVDPLTSVTHKNAECLTINKNDTECQTTTTRSVQIENEFIDDKKTEDTLNQIKVILQTVLTEVKTKKCLEEKATKDAVVRGCSSLLHSCSYSPYNMNPYLASCSRQINSRSCYGNVPYISGKCMQNFPVFIQTPRRNVCANCYRNSSHIAKANTRQAATIATNTESKEHSKETEKLIKEIYKSMAVNLVIPAKGTSLSEYGDLKSTPHRSLNTSINRGSKAEENTKKMTKPNTAASRNSNLKDSPLNSKLTSNTASTRSKIVSTTDTETYLRNSRIESYLKNLDGPKPIRNKFKEDRIYEEPTSSSSQDEDDESVSNDGSDENVMVPVAIEEPKKKPVKKSLLSKMFNKSVKIFTTKNKKKIEQIQTENERDAESGDESDDYQTIYSQREQPRNTRYGRYPTHPIKIKSRPKISFPRRVRNQNAYRRVPYMEQEDRRYWNEELMFRKSPLRYSSEKSRSRSSRRRSNPVFWQNYEARSAIIRRSNVSPVVCNSVKKFVPPRPPRRYNGPKVNVAAKGLSWLKKH